MEAPGRGILIVDDNRDFRGMLKTLIDKEGLFGQYYEAGDGEEAIGFLKTDPRVDFVLVDLIMPKTSGIDVITWARGMEQYRDLPILVLSVEGRGHMKACGLNLGASDYVVKPFDPGELVARIRLLLKRKEVQDELKHKNAELTKINEDLRKLSVTDELTQLYNRSHFFECLAQEMKRCMRYRVKMTLMLIDLDNFKQVNDTYGHQAGDAVLKETAMVLKDSVRDSDAVGRYGADEFVLYLVQTDIDGASVPAERIRASVAGKVFAFPDGTFRSTVSIGMAEFPPAGPESRDEFINRADLALYEAKMTGKNKVAGYGG